MGLKSGTSTKSFQRFYVNCTDTNKKEIGVMCDKNHKLDSSSLDI